MSHINFNKALSTLFLYTITLIFMSSCLDSKSQDRPALLPSWTERSTSIPVELAQNPTKQAYLPVYSEIYSNNQHRTHALTATISIRNVNIKDTIWVTGIDYFNTEGTLIKNYIDQPIYLTPLETIEIVIAEDDLMGGSGSNFIFSWIDQSPDIHPPLTQAVMISTSGQQGISFVTEGIPIQ